MPKGKTFLYGVLSGIVEPVAALLSIAAASAVVSVLSYLLAFAARVMMYVVVEELIPEMSEGEHSNVGIAATISATSSHRFWKRRNPRSLPLLPPLPAGMPWNRPISAQVFLKTMTFSRPAEKIIFV